MVGTLADNEKKQQDISKQVKQFENTLVDMLTTQRQALDDIKKDFR
jgi:hypothetical protein